MSTIDEEAVADQIRQRSLARLGASGQPSTPAPPMNEDAIAEGIRSRRTAATTQAPTPQPAIVSQAVKPQSSSFLDTLKSWAPAITRGASGLLGAEGGWPGAAIGGGGEALAEKLEGQPLSAARIGVAAGTGAIPFHFLAPAGRIGAAMIRGGALGGAGTAATEALTGEKLDPTSILASTALGAASSGVGSKLGEMFANRAKPYEVVPTAQEGGQNLSGAKQTFSKGQWRSSGGTMAPVVPPPPIRPGGGSVAAPIPEGVSGGSIPYGGVSPAPYRSAAKATVKADTVAQATADKAQAAKDKASSIFDLFNTMTPEEEEAAAHERSRMALSKSQYDINQMADLADESHTLVPASSAPTRAEQLSGLNPTGSSFQQLAEELGLKAPETSSPAAPYGSSEMPAQLSETPAAASTPPPGDAPQPVVAKFFKTKGGAAGYNYRLAKEAEAAGDIPTAKYARDARVRQAIEDKAAQGGSNTGVGASGGMAPTAEEAAAAGKAGRPLGTAANQATLNDPDNVRWLSRLANLKNAGGSESGQISPKMLKAMATGGGALVGAPIGAQLNEQDPTTGAVQGALAGGTAGLLATSGLQEAINWRNAGLLSGMAQGKKVLSDAGNYAGLAAEKAMSGHPDVAANMVKEGLRLPTNAKNYWKGLMDPELARGALGELAPSEGTTGALGMVARPFAAAQYATQQAMQRAGVPTEEAVKSLLIGEPTTAPAKWWLQGNKFGLVRAVRPFARIATNLAERGLERTPGLSLMMGPPETRLARTVLGAGAMGVGGAIGQYENAQDEAGTPVSPAIKGLLRAAAGSYAVPLTLGEATLGDRGPLESWRMFPGFEQTMPRPSSKDTMGTYGKKLGLQWLDQELPSFLAPDKGTAR